MMEIILIGILIIIMIWPKKRIKSSSQALIKLLPMVISSTENEVTGKEININVSIRIGYHTRFGAKE